MILLHLKELCNQRKKTVFSLTPSVNCKQIPHLVGFKNKYSNEMQKTMYQFKNTSETK